MSAPAKLGQLMVFAFPTPGASNFVLRVLRDPKAAGYERLDLGTPLFDCDFLQMRETERTEYDGFALAKITPELTEQQHREAWYFLRPWQDENDWNFTTKYLDESSQHPAIQRSYVIPREDYEAQANGNNADPVEEGYTLLSQEQVRSDDPIIDALFVAVVRTYAPLPGAIRLGSSSGDLQTAVPPEFRRDLKIEATYQKVLPETEADRGAEVLESQVVPESVAFSEKTTFRIKDGELPKTLVEYDTDRDGQVITRTKVLDDSAQTITPSATVTGAVENRGGGLTLKTEDAIPGVFDGKQVAAEKPDVVPERFRASAPAQTTVETQAGASVTMPTLGDDDLNASEQRVTVHTKRVARTSRDNGTLPTLHGQDYDAALDVALPYSEQVVDSGTLAGSPATEIDPLSDDLDLVRTVDLEAIGEALDGILLEFPTRTSLSLPPILKALSVVWDRSNEEGSFNSDWGGAATALAGYGWHLAGSERGNANSSAGLMPSWRVDLEEVWATNIPTTSYVFFLPYPVTEAAILAKVSALTWPVFKPKSYTLTAFGQKVGVTAEVSAAASHEQRTNEDGDIVSDSVDKTTGSGTSASIASTSAVIRIPACLHAGFTINESETEGVTAEANVGWSGTNFPSVSLTATRTGTATGSASATLTATSPADVPRTGRYLIDSRVEMYQFGYAKVYAEVLDAIVLA